MSTGRIHHRMSTNFDGPSLEDLAAIDNEWPAIQADIDALADPDYIDALVDAIDVVERMAAAAMDRRRKRRLTARITRVATELAARPVPRGHVCDPWRATEIAMSDCHYGCKVMRCDDCGAEHVEHRAAYGCPTGRAALAAARKQAA